MATKSPMEVGVFEDYQAAERAVANLVEAGFDRTSISVVCPTCSVRDFPDVEHVKPAGSHTPVAAATGGVIGSMLGGLVIAGIAASGGTALLVAGPLFASAAAVGGVTGAFLGAMATRGLEPEIANFYDQALEKGQILVAVDIEAGPGRARAVQALHEAGAQPIALPRG
jgi:hypothetical protein